MLKRNGITPKMRFSELAKKKKIKEMAKFHLSDSWVDNWEHILSNFKYLHYLFFAPGFLTHIWESLPTEGQKDFQHFHVFDLAHSIGK